MSSFAICYKILKNEYTAEPHYYNILITSLLSSLSVIMALSESNFQLVLKEITKYSFLTGASLMTSEIISNKIMKIVWICFFPSSLLVPGMRIVPDQRYRFLIYIIFLVRVFIDIGSFTGTMYCLLNARKALTVLNNLTIKKLYGNQQD